MVRTTGSYEPDQGWTLLWTAFDIGSEGNVAVWFASTMWLLVGALAAMAALTSDRFRTSWWVFAAVAVIASADEAAQLHERLFYFGDRLAPTLPGDLHYSWVIPGTAIALVVAALLIRLVLALRTRVTVGLIGSAVVFLLGALVIESISGIVERVQGMSDLYVAIMYVEETFELIGVAWAVIALASMFRLTGRRGSLTLTFDGFPDRAEETGPGHPVSG
ncbi:MULTISPECIES: hypothetical protein [unclassified Dietzia]|uniref:hypothetical protein n=1 Tax=unclassified Dietzia TaxID=2617939 RepID=UPI000D223ABB|nr:MULTISPECIES: hypothetical protein [unclassified Dietzia]AVZ39449.1 hypothetical protein CT688_08165 [Dietzia sp. JS16-p6b]QGW24726.1 hypothetical protein GJR88_02602 [Dietzia sp. DQ12-45-1b]